MSREFEVETQFFTLQFLEIFSRFMIFKKGEVWNNIFLIQSAIHYYYSFNIKQISTLRMGSGRYRGK